ncbi:hypothetical protein [Rubritalea marina]|uniref:hypothetical protein n=1 Tax=Rubritalea marina TaxID=361055 RepID=UPI0003660359|nr:hypothetical protein [Rubritalea marina]
MKRSGASIIKILVYIVVLTSLGTLGVQVALAWIPRTVAVDELTQATEEAATVDLVKRMESSLEKDYTITITEAELNQYLKQHMQIGHSSLVGEFVTITDIRADLKDGEIDLTIEREFDLPGNARDDGSKRVSALPIVHTCSMTMKVFSEATAEGIDVTVVEFPGGHLGQAQLPGLLVSIVKPSFDALADSLVQEIDLGFHDMAKVKVSDGQIDLDPRLSETASAQQ